LNNALVTMNIRTLSKTKTYYKFEILYKEETI